MGEVFRRSDPIVNNNSEIRGVDPVNMNHGRYILAVTGVLSGKNTFVEIDADEKVLGLHLLSLLPFLYKVGDE